MAASGVAGGTRHRHGITCGKVCQAASCGGGGGGSSCGCPVPKKAPEATWILEATTLAVPPMYQPGKLCVALLSHEGRQLILKRSC